MMKCSPCISLIDQQKTKFNLVFLFIKLIDAQTLNALFRQRMRTIYAGIGYKLHIM